MNGSRVAVIACSATIALAVFGCGGGDSSGDSGGSNDTQAVDQDQAQITALVDDFNQAIKTKDVKQFCGLFDPETIAEALGPKNTCVKIFGPLLKKSQFEGKVKVKDIDVDGDSATVTSAGQGSEQDFEKVDGHWYFSTPSTAAK